MGIFNNQFLNVIEWNEQRDDVLFWMWKNQEIKKNSRLVIRPGQDAIFLNNGKIEGIFTDEGNYEIETQIIPFLSTLKGFKFGFNSGLRAEVLFVNTKEFMVKWGTKSPINIPAPGMPGGMPIRCYGSFVVKISDYVHLIDNIAGVKAQFSVDDVKQRVLSLMDQLVMKWIVREGKDMFNLQVNSMEIADGIKKDLDMELVKIGLTINSLIIENFSYPEAVQKMIDKNAAYGMVGNVGHYQQVSVMESMEKNPDNMMGNMVQAGMGMQMGLNMMNQMNNNLNSQNNQNIQNNNPSGTACSTCQAPLAPNAKFCAECGTKVSETKGKFCSECGTVVENNSKFCGNCGNKIN